MATGELGSSATCRTNFGRDPELPFSYADLHAASHDDDKGAMPPLVLVVSACRAAHARFAQSGVEFTREPISRFGSVDASFRDPSGNGWELVAAR